MVYRQRSNTAPTGQNVERNEKTEMKRDALKESSKQLKQQQQKKKKDPMLELETAYHLPRRYQSVLPSEMVIAIMYGLERNARNILSMVKTLYTRQISKRVKHWH